MLALELDRFLGSNAKAHGSAHAPAARKREDASGGSTHPLARERMRWGAGNRRQRQVQGRGKRAYSKITDQARELVELVAQCVHPARGGTAWIDMGRFTGNLRFEMAEALLAVGGRRTVTSKYSCWSIDC